MTIRVFAISDPHLSFSRPKPMDVFGSHWTGHAERLAEHWRAAVEPNDIVLVPGDVSWGMRLADALPDLEWLAALPGRKVLLRGNHDYWWASPAKLRALNLPGMHFIQNDSLLLDGVAIGGSRLWDFPFVKWGIGETPADAEKAEGDHAPKTSTGQKPEDPEKIRARELERLAASLRGLDGDAALRVAMTHYPPLGEDGAPTALTDLIGGFNVDLCVFGHIHAHAVPTRPGEDATVGRTRYRLVSCDFLGFKPLLVGEV